MVQGNNQCNVTNSRFSQGFFEGIEPIKNISGLRSNDPLWFYILGDSLELMEIVAFASMSINSSDLPS